MKQKYHLAMDDAERRLLIGSLNDIAAGSSQRANIPMLLTKCC